MGGGGGVGEAYIQALNDLDVSSRSRQGGFAKRRGLRRADRERNFTQLLQNTNTFPYSRATADFCDNLNTPGQN